MEEGCAEEARRLEKERAETGLADERDLRGSDRHGARQVGHEPERP